MIKRKRKPKITTGTLEELRKVYPMLMWEYYTEDRKGITRNYFNKLRLVHESGTNLWSVEKIKTRKR